MNRLDDDMPVDQSLQPNGTDKQDETPDRGPYNPTDNPDGWLPLPLWICSCEHIDEPDPWYKRLADRVTGWFRQR